MEINFYFPSSGHKFDYKLLFDLAPHLVWALIFLIVIWMIGPNRIAVALLNARKISFAGVEIDLRDNITEAVHAKGFDASSALEEQVALRAQRSRTLTMGARLLWIDEHPSNNHYEVRLFRRLGIMIDLATSDADARNRLGSGVYDVVLSSWTREGDKEAGKTLIPMVRAALLSPEIIFYVGKERDVPIGAFGLTVRPDELLNLVLDVLERKRG